MNTETYDKFAEFQQRADELVAGFCDQDVLSEAQVSESRALVEEYAAFIETLDVEVLSFDELSLTQEIDGFFAKALELFPDGSDEILREEFLNTGKNNRMFERYEELSAQEEEFHFPHGALGMLSGKGLRSMTEQLREKRHFLLVDGTKLRDLSNSAAYERIILERELSERTVAFMFREKRSNETIGSVIPVGKLTSRTKIYDSLIVAQGKDRALFLGVDLPDLEGDWVVVSNDYQHSSMIPGSKIHMRVDGTAGQNKEVTISTYAKEVDPVAAQAEGGPG